jgi:hypothetical protein
MASLDLDLTNARDDGDDLGGIAARLRYVAFVNPEATQASFVAAAVRVGFNRGTAAIQFRKSRAMALADFGGELLADGRWIEPQDVVTNA